VVFELPASRVDGALAVFNAFRGHIDGVNGYGIATALATIREHHISQVFVDGSNLRGICGQAQTRRPRR